MHLKCNCLVQNRTNNLAMFATTTTAVSTSNKKPSRSIVSLGSDRKTNRVSLTVSTATNQNLVTCNVVDNVDHVFDKFVKDGKLTIRLKQPEIDLLLSGVDSVALGAFLKALKSTSNGELVEENEKSKIFYTKKSIRAKDFKKPKLVLSIEERKYYPFAEPLPSTLEQFRAVNCRLEQFDRRISKLHRLTSLDLSNNSLKTNLEFMDFSNLRNLTEINFNANGLDELPNVFWSTLPQCLTKLRLSQNRFSRLPDVLWDRKLTLLDVSRNQLTGISLKIDKCRFSLKSLHVNDNRITMLPDCLLRFRLDQLDLSSNPYKTEQHVQDGPYFGNVETLQNLALKIVHLKKLPTHVLPSSLVGQLKNSIRYCSHCSTRCIESSCRLATVLKDVKRIATNFVFLSGENHQAVPLTGYYCSLTCFQVVSKNHKFA